MKNKLIILSFASVTVLVFATLISICLVKINKLNKQLEIQSNEISILKKETARAIAFDAATYDVTGYIYNELTGFESWGNAYCYPSYDKYSLDVYVGDELIDPRDGE